MQTYTNKLFKESIKQYRLHAFENVIPCLGIRGKSCGSVRESGDSVEHLEEYSGARASTFGELGARGVQLECTGGARAGAQLARTGALERASTGALFTREHVLHPE
ncbi:hypothetical protein CRG98_006397 [Punica granatum]|uniref:Uncharacterized protein n=1 Tax=Punica granatum TaxID=22663 RepID=A0A2I0KXL0_PUNGR|nr:hypothetical protein CRG98_006397 [Punica granatum]